MGPNVTELTRIPTGRMEKRLPASISVIPNFSFNNGSVEPMMTMEIPKRKIPMKLAAKAMYFCLIFLLY